MGLNLVKVGLAMIFIGLISSVALAVLAALMGVKGRIRGAGIVMIGPIPIIFGDVRLVKPLILMAIVLMILGLLIMFIPSLTWRWM